MLKLKNLSEAQLNAISQEVTDAFFDFPYFAEDEGLIRFIKTREDMFTYMNAIILASYRSGLLYATSERQEGYCVFVSTKGPQISFMNGMKMIAAEKRALGGFKNMRKFIRCCWAEGGSIETRTRKAKRGFIKIEMLVVRREYQGQGYMRQMLSDIYSLADRIQLPVILDTDDKRKCQRYEHLGMTLERIRSGGERFHMYDLIREPVLHQ